MTRLLPQNINVHSLIYFFERVFLCAEHGLAGSPVKLNSDDDDDDAHCCRSLAESDLKMRSGYAMFSVLTMIARRQRRNCKREVVERSLGLNANSSAKVSLH